mgnify:CR=1 FL=1|jgi:hypothetical protein
MIEWIISKTGMIIFILIVAGALLYFTNIQNTIYKNSSQMQDTENIARISDSLCKNYSTNYTFSDGKNVVITNDNGKIKIK